MPSLHSDAHSESQSALRTLVSDQYPEMLGTASTVIDMAGSARSLFQHAKRIYASTCSQDVLRRNASAPDADADGKQATSAETRKIYEVAATTKLLDALISDAEGFLEGSAGRQGSPLTLHGSWACVLARSAWGHVNEVLKSSEWEETAEATQLFPYIHRRRQRLQPLKEELLKACESQLSSEGLGYRVSIEHVYRFRLLLNCPRPGLAISLDRDNAARKSSYDEITGTDARATTKMPRQDRVSGRFRAARKPCAGVLQHCGSIHAHIRRQCLSSRPRLHTANICKGQR